MIKKKTLTPIILAGIFCIMLSLSFAAVPLYDLFCRVTGFGGTTQISKDVPKILHKAPFSKDKNIKSRGDLSGKIRNIGDIGFTFNLELKYAF